MKRILAVACIFLFLLSGTSMADFNSHPRYAVVETLVQALITKVRIAEATYFTANHKYFQGIITPSTPQDGMTDATPNWAVKPTDQIESWKDFDSTTFKTQFKIPFQIRIDVYESPAGWGWILTIDVWKAGLGPDQFGTDGIHWKYQHHEGPEVLSGPWDTWFILPEEY
jgi:hypothetical protein